MKARTRIAGMGAAALALVAGSVHAHEPEPDAVEQEPRVEGHEPWADVTGRLRASANGVSLEIGGALVELRITGGELSAGEPGGGRAGAHDLRASITVDGKTTNLQLRIVPPPADEPAPKK